MRRHDSRGHSHTQTEPYYPDGAECRECPASYVTEDSMQLVALFNDARLARKSTGTSVLTSMIRADVRLFDAAVVIEACRVAHDAALKKVFERD